MLRWTFVILVAALLLSTVSTAHALNIDIDYSYDTNLFFSAQARKDTLRAAADFFELILTDDLDAITPGGGNTWDANFIHPGTGAPQAVSNLSIAADTLLVYAGGRELGGSTLGKGGPGGFSASGVSQAWLDTVEFRGETGAPATDFGPWGGSLAFDSIGTSWYFDSNPATDEVFAGNDFYSVALHELGHLLGFGTATSWVVDVAAGQYYGADSMAVNAGAVTLDGIQVHWEEGTSSPMGGAGSFETAMDPTITSGDRKRFTDLDLAALSDIGWDVVIPEPATIFVMTAAGLPVLLGRRRSRG